MTQAGGNDAAPVRGGAPSVPGAAANPVEFFVPYKNTPALVAYYLGIFAFIPVLGIFLGVPAFIMGIKGLRVAREHPEARGKAHAWVGIIMGAIFGFGQVVICLLVVAGLLLTHFAR